METVRKESKENPRTGLHNIYNKKFKGLDTSKEWISEFEDKSSSKPST